MKDIKLKMKKIKNQFKEIEKKKIEIYDYDLLRIEMYFHKIEKILDENIL